MFSVQEDAMLDSAMDGFNQVGLLMALMPGDAHIDV